MARVGRRGRVGTLVVLATALAAMLAPAAGAQAPQPDTRAEAATFARLALDTRSKLRAGSARVEGSLKRLERFSERCPALERASKRASEEDIEVLSTAVSARFAYAPVLGTLDGFAAELEAAAVSDRTLRDGAAAWRTTVESLRTFTRLPARLCAAIRQWARSGYARGRAPVDAQAIKRADKRGERAVDVIERASRRLRALGASADAAKAFTFDELLNAALDEEEESGSSGA